MSAGKTKENVNFLYNVLEMIKNSKEIIYFLIVTVVPNVVSFLTKNMVTIIVVLIVTITLLIGFIIYSRMRNIKGTFAVSAFIFYGTDNQLLLHKSENELYKNRDFYVQPSTFYKKKRAKGEAEFLQTPYQKLQEYLNKELNIYIEHLQLASLQPVNYDLPLGNQKLSDFLAKNRAFIAMDKDADMETVENNMRNYKNNEISLSPWLTIVEKNLETLKSSKEKLHIDYYYVFNLEQQNETIKEYIEEGKFLLTTRKELSELISKNQTHGDLLAIYDILVAVKSKMKPYPQISINNCTFTCKKKTAYWRITENCNCNCQYCFIEKSKTNGDIKVPDKVVQKVIDIIENNNIEKLVISGGEPLLVDNLTNIVKEVSSANGGALKISICTNGLLDFADFDKLSQIPQFQKFVVSLDGYDQSTYGKFKKLTKGGKSADIKKVKSFIARARAQKIRVAANVILSYDLKKGLDQYIQQLRELNVNELSISTLITNNEKNRRDKRYLSNTAEIMNFYADIINYKMDACSFLDKLDFIIPSCVCQGGNCGCGNMDNLMYISPNGEARRGCTEKMQKEPTQLGLML